MGPQFPISPYMVWKWTLLGPFLHPSSQLRALWAHIVTPLILYQILGTLEIDKILIHAGITAHLIAFITLQDKVSYFVIFYFHPMCIWVEMPGFSIGAAWQCDTVFVSSCSPIQQAVVCVYCLGGYILEKAWRTISEAVSVSSPKKVGVRTIFLRWWAVKSYKIHA